MKRKTILWAVLVLMVIIGIFAIISGGDDKTKTSSQPKRKISVEIKHDSFDPATVVIKPGTTVTWTNEEDDLPHKVAANPYPSHSDLPSLVSGELQEGDSYSYTFNKSGTFRYHDDLRPTMNGTIIVK